MRNLILIIYLTIPILTYSQKYNVDIKLSYWTDTINNKEIAPIVRLYKNYLESNPDSIYDNPYWNNNEKKLYKKFDFAANVIFNPESWSAKNLFGMYSVYLLNIEKKDSIYLIQSMLIDYNLSKGWEKYNPIAIIRTAAIPDKNGYKLANSFPFITRNWHTKSNKYITYHFTQETYYSDSLNLQNEKFCNNLMTRYGFKQPSNIELYVVDGIHEVGKILGYDYYIYGFASGKTIENIIISGNKTIYYPHELVHQFIDKNPQRNILLEEGFATYLGGNGGEPYNILLKDYAKAYQELKLDFIEASKGEKLNFYPLEAIIIDIIQTDYGDKILKDLLMEPTQTLDDLFVAIKKLTKLSKEEFVMKVNKKILKN